MLQQVLDDYQIRFFRAGELTLLRRFGTHAEVPKALIPNIIPTVRIADTIRAAYGSPILVVSGMRPDSYNKLVGGSPTSEHTVFKALDLRPADGDMARFRVIVAAVVQAYRDMGVNVGLGYYNTFIHIDTNAIGKTRNRTWKT